MHNQRRRAWRAALVAAALVLATEADAQGTQANAVDDLLHALQLKATPAPAPAFVVESRPKGEQPFIPVGTRHPERTLKVLSPAEIAATEAELDGARERQQRRAGQKPAALPLKVPKDGKGAKTTVR